MRKVWIAKGKVATINQMGYELVIEIRKSTKIAAYWKQGMGDMCEVIIDEDRAIGIKCGRKRVVGVYAKGNDSRRGYEEWVERVARNIRSRDGVVMGDWNAYHESCSLDRGTSTNGRVLQEAMEDVGSKWIGARGPTWKRRVDGELLQGRIDLVFVKGMELKGKIKRLKLASDH